MKVTLMPDGGVSCVDGPTAASASSPPRDAACSSSTASLAESNNNNSSTSCNNSHSGSKSRLPLPSILCRRIGVQAEAYKRFGSADNVTSSAGSVIRHRNSSNGTCCPPSPPPSALPRRGGRRSLPCRAANINEYTSELQNNRAVLARRQSQPEYVGVAR